MAFQNNYANLVSQRSEAHTRLIRDYDGPNPDFDYIVIGSGIGGGTVADDLADRNPGKRILVVDVGSFVYPTHVYNISRIPNGAVAEHFGADNFLQTATHQQLIGGKPQLVFGGRSIFWSGLIPQPQDWELDFFPAAIAADLKGNYLKLAGERMNESLTLGSKARELVAHFRNSSIANDFAIHETPRALHQPYLLADGTPADKFFVEPTGVFNTAELLINQTGLTRPELDLNGCGLFVKLNSFVEAVNSVPHDWYEVKTTNTVTGEQRSFYTQKVIIAAGSTESPKLINRSSVFHTLPADIKQLVGFGLTDHPVSAESQAYVSSVGNPSIEISPDDHAKIIFYSKGKLDANGHLQYPFNVEMNINHEYWHLRNNDPASGLTDHDPTPRVDIKFSFANCLDDQNGIHSHANDGYTPYISFKRFANLDDLLNSRFPSVAGWQKNTADFMTLLNQTRDRIFNEFNDLQVLTGRYGGYPGEQWPFGWGTVHHACGTLRMPWKVNRNSAFNSRSVVDENLKVHGTTGLYVCDMSVLPVSTAANPVRALAGLALRLSQHLG